MNTYKVTLTKEERDQLTEMTRTGTHAARKIIHALILLNVDRGSHTESQINEDICKVLNNQCLGRRIDSIDKVRGEVEAWEKARNGFNKKINWQFTTDKARIKLRRLYPSYDR